MFKIVYSNPLTILHYAKFWPLRKVYAKNEPKTIPKHSKNERYITGFASFLRFLGKILQNLIIETLTEYSFENLEV